MGREKPHEDDLESLRNIKDLDGLSIKELLEELGDADTIRSMTEKDRQKLLKVLKEINKS